jgi:beta-phosphoglucomutase-like phosphatase (HAD superfamily)
MAAARRTIVLFDVDGTLTPSRKVATPAILTFLQTLRGKVRAGTPHTCPPSSTPAEVEEAARLRDWDEGARFGVIAAC